MQRRAWRPLLLDGALAAGFAGVALLELRVEAREGLYYVGEALPNIVIAVLTALALAVRRVWPVPLAVTVFGVHALLNVTVPHALAFFGTFVPLLVLSYTLGRHAQEHLVARTVVVPLSFVATFWVHTPDARTVDDFAVIGGALGAAWLAGWTISRLARQRESLDDALAQLTALEEDRRRQVLLEERTRIAREMHDVVAHGVSVMVVQAGAARMELDEGDAAAQRFLLAVERAGRDVLTELRRTVGLLRSGVGGAEDRPAPGLQDIPDLVAAMRGAGLDIELHLADDLETDPGRGLTAFRVVQESLTNALRHAGRTSVVVRVNGSPDLVIEVADSGRLPGARPKVQRGGHGLVGMRERVAMYGGRFRAGMEGDGDGFTVRAEIPAEQGS